MIIHDQVVNAMVDQQFHGRFEEGMSCEASISSIMEELSVFHPRASPGEYSHLRQVFRCKDLIQC